LKNKQLPDRIAKMATITNMERGHLSVIRTNSDGTKYYNLQRRENGRNVTEYIPHHQLPDVEKNIAAYQEFQQLVEEHVAEISQQSRQQRKAEVKKNPRNTSPSNSPNKKKSKNSSTEPPDSKKWAATTSPEPHKSSITTTPSNTLKHS
jgi:hypothetical protein